MATIINADTSDGLKLTSDTSGQIDFQSAGSTKALIDTSGNLKFNSGLGSVGTAYGVRAFVNFNGTGTVAIRKSGNVSSITDNGTGAYTANFATAMPDANFTAVTFNNQSTGTAAGNYNNGTFGGLGDRTTTSVKMFPNAANADSFQMDLIIVR